MTSVTSHMQHLSSCGAGFVGVLLVILNLCLVQNNKHRPLIPRKIDSRKIVTEVVVMMPSPIVWRHRRDLVSMAYHNQRWPGSKVQFLYVIGSKDGPRLEVDLNLTDIYQEMNEMSYFKNLRYFISSCRDMGDELLNPNGTSGTSCKAYQGFKYAYDNYVSFKYVWRGADDAYINLQFFFHRVMPVLEEQPTSAIYMGLLRRNLFYEGDIHSGDMNIWYLKPHFREVWHTPDFGDYMLGMGFVLSAPVVELLAKWNIEPLQTWCEDVVVGEWLRPFQIKWINAEDYGWYVNQRETYDAIRCKNQLLVHYPQKEDFFNIDSKGRMTFCKWKTQFSL